MNITNVKKAVLSIGAGLLVPASIYAANATLPHTFSAGTAIRAEEVNANFAALRVAVNTKADATNSSPTATSSGQRLKLIGFSSPDGFRLPLHVDEGQMLIYDTSLQMYCEPDSVTTAPGIQETLCIPVWYSWVPSQSGPAIWADSTCRQHLFFTRNDQLPPGMPPAAKFLREYDGDGVLHLFRAITTVRSSVYVIQSDGTCISDSTISGTFYVADSEVPLSSIARLTLGTL